MLARSGTARRNGMSSWCVSSMRMLVAVVVLVMVVGVKVIVMMVVVMFMAVRALTYGWQ